MTQKTVFTEVVVVPTDTEVDDKNNTFGRRTWFNASFSILMNRGVFKSLSYKREEGFLELISI